MVSTLLYFIVLKVFESYFVKIHCLSPFEPHNTAARGYSAYGVEGYTRFGRQVGRAHNE